VLKHQISKLQQLNIRQQARKHVAPHHQIYLVTYRTSTAGIKTSSISKNPSAQATDTETAGFSTSRMEINIRYGNMQRLDIRCGKVHCLSIRYGNIQWLNMRCGNIQRLNIRSGNIQRLNIKYGNIQASK
jgi:hypothetical protein